MLWRVNVNVPDQRRDWNSDGKFSVLQQKI